MVRSTQLRVRSHISPDRDTNQLLDHDIMRIAPEQVLRTQVLATYVGGKAVYERKAVIP